MLTGNGNSTVLCTPVDDVCVLQTTPVLVGLSVAAAALIGRSAVQAFHAMRHGPQQFYKVITVPSRKPHSALSQGGFLAEMTRREAALILGLRESAAESKIKEAHRRIMVANHPDAGDGPYLPSLSYFTGGSSYIAAKVNEAKDMLLGKRSGKSSAL